MVLCTYLYTSVGEGSLIATAWNRINIFSCILIYYVPTHLSIYLVVEQEKRVLSFANLRLRLGTIQTQHKSLAAPKLKKLQEVALPRVAAALEVELKAKSCSSNRPTTSCLRLTLGAWRQLFILSRVMQPAAEGWKEAKSCSALSIWMEKSIRGQNCLWSHSKGLWSYSPTNAQGLLSHSYCLTISQLLVTCSPLFVGGERCF